MLTSCHGRLGPVCKGPQGRPDVPGYSLLFQMAHSIDEPSRVTRAHDRDSSGSTSSPGLLTLVSEGPWG